MYIVVLLFCFVFLLLCLSCFGLMFVFKHFKQTVKTVNMKNCLFFNNWLFFIYCNTTNNNTSLFLGCSQFNAIDYETRRHSCSSSYNDFINAFVNRWFDCSLGIMGGIMFPWWRVGNVYTGPVLLLRSSQTHIPQRMWTRVVWLCDCHLQWYNYKALEALCCSMSS